MKKERFDWSALNWDADKDKDNFSDESLKNGERYIRARYRMEDLIRLHHIEIYRKMGFKKKPCAFEKSMPYSIGTEFNLIHEYAMPECVGVMCMVDFRITDFLTRESDYIIKTRRKYPFIMINAVALPTGRLDEEETKRTAMGIASHRHPKKPSIVEAKSIGIRKELESHEIYHAKLDEESTNEEIMSAINKCIDTVDERMKSVLGFERTSLRM